MAVYTQISQQDCEEILNACSLGTYDRHEPIEQGVENTNYHLWTDQGRYILTVFEARIEKDDLPFVFDLQKTLQANGVVCPVVLHEGEIKNKPFAISSFLDGVTLDVLGAEQCEKAGAALAELHQASLGFVPRRSNPMGMQAWQALFEQTRAYMNEDEIEKIEEILSVPNHINCPTGSIHADFFPDNVFFDDEKNNVAGIIDFYFACTDYLIYDVAIAMNAWDYPEAFVEGYQSVRPFTGHEKIWLPLMRKRAALRIFLTRLYDWHNTPESATVVKKDPYEYWDLLKGLE